MKLGKVSDSVLKRSVLKQIHTKRTDIKNGAGEDCAIFACSDTPGEWMASCVQEALLTDVEGEPGFSVSHLVHKCANNLAVSGAMPMAVMITLLLPPETEEPYLRGLMREADDACESLGMQIMGGQTRITAGVNAPMAVMTGYGRLFAEPTGNEPACMKGAAAGQDIVLSKWIGLEGTAVLSRRGVEALKQRYPAYLVEEAAGFERYLSILPEAATAVKSGVCAMHDASEGGIFAALWELAEAAGVGLTIDLKKLPIRQETVEVCEVMNANPYELMSGGCLIMTTEDGNGLVAALEAEGIPATVVGKITDSNDRLILNEEEVRYMDRPKQDAVYEA